LRTNKRIQRSQTKNKEKNTIFIIENLINISIIENLINISIIENLIKIFITENLIKLSLKKKPKKNGGKKG
jgi:hypothetical protein